MGPKFKKDEIVYISHFNKTAQIVCAFKIDCHPHVIYYGVCLGDDLTLNLQEDQLQKISMIF
jgi:hypothetical protein